MPRFALLLLFSLTLAACSNVQDFSAKTDTSQQHDHEEGSVHLADANAVASFFVDGSATLARDEPFIQVGLMLSAKSVPTLEYKTAQGNWRDAEITWLEAPLYNARIILEAPVKELELRALHVDSLSMYLYDQATPAPDSLARELPFEKAPESGLVPQIAPGSLVVSRYEWGARDPGKVCGDTHNPYRMTIHHTVGSSGKSDPKAVMRQIQAFHIDTRGWCDVGYHFIVSDDGTIFQGRSSEKRTGVHVANGNTGNIGVSLMGDFRTTTPPSSQLDGAARIVGWVSRTYGIALNRTNVKGHREWPDNLTSCPGDRLLALIPTILSRAGGNPPPAPCTIKWPTVKESSIYAREAKIAQYLLRSRGYSLATDGKFGSETKRTVQEFQRSLGLDDDGVVGQNTWPKLIKTVRYGSDDEAVKAVQLRLKLAKDGKFGPTTLEAVKRFQKNKGLTADGVVGPDTWIAMVGGKGCP